jgi:hypothetical protein
MALTDAQKAGIEELNRRAEEAGKAEQARIEAERAAQPK